MALMRKPKRYISILKRFPKNKKAFEGISSSITGTIFLILPEDQ